MVEKDETNHCRSSHQEINHKERPWRIDCFVLVGTKQNSLKKILKRGRGLLNLKRFSQGFDKSRYHLLLCVNFVTSLHEGCSSASTTTEGQETMARGGGVSCNKSPLNVGNKAIHGRLKEVKKVKADPEAPKA